jgi:hypothetical protein
MSLPGMHASHSLAPSALYPAMPSRPPARTRVAPHLPARDGTTVQRATAVYVSPAIRNRNLFLGVIGAWDPAAAPDSGVSVASPGQPWQYTATFQWTVPYSGANYKVRGHVHYTTAVGGGYNKGPGNTWVQGIGGNSTATPQAAVDGAPANPVFAAYGNW